MYLSEWLKINRVSQLELAKELDVPQSLISKYVHGLHMPRRQLMERILEITKGAVTPNDLYDAAEKKKTSA